MKEIGAFLTGERNDIVPALNDGLIRCIRNGLIRFETIDTKSQQGQQIEGVSLQCTSQFKAGPS